MAKGLVWATAEDLASNRGRVLSLYRQILRSLNSPNLPLNLAARLAMKAEVRTIFIFGSEERSLHNIADLIDTAEYSLSLLRKGEIPDVLNQANEQRSSKQNLFHMIHRVCVGECAIDYQIDFYAARLGHIED